MMRTGLIILVTILAFVSPVRATETVRIGVFQPMVPRDGHPAWGQLTWEAIRVAWQLEPEVLGKPVELHLEKTRLDMLAAADAAASLIEKGKVVSIIGGMTSGMTGAGSAHAERNRVPIVSGTAGHSSVTRYKKYVFRVCATDSDQGRVAARLALDRLAAKTAAVIHAFDQPYGLEQVQAFRDRLTAGGGKIVADTKFKCGDGDFSLQDFVPQLSRIKASKPDIIYAPVRYPECALIARLAREMGLDVPILTGDGAQSPELIKVGGKAVEGVYVTAQFHREKISTQRGRDFLALYEKETAKELDANAALAADAYFIILDAIKRTGSPDPVKIAQGLRSTKDFEGVTGKIALGPDGNAIKAMVINKVQEGKFVYVTTMEP